MLVAICPVAVKWRQMMLENINYGDICVFSNGEEAAVTDFKKDGSYAISIEFNKDVIGFSDQAEKRWCYDYNGRFFRDADDPDGNDIVKIVRS